MSRIYWIFHGSENVSEKTKKQARFLEFSTLSCVSFYVQSGKRLTNRNRPVRTGVFCRFFIVYAHLPGPGVG